MNNQQYENNGIKTFRLGLGCMRLSIRSELTRSENISIIHAALDSGIDHLNTGDFYGEDGHNELLVGEALKGYKREQAFVSLKYGTFGNPPMPSAKIDVGPKNVKKYLTNSLKRLDLDYVDLYQPARIDIGIPIEETIGAISDLIKSGYVKYLGVSEVDAPTLRKVHDVHPVSFIESEFSITNNDIEDEILPTTRELGIGVVAFGILTFGKFHSIKRDPLIEIVQKIAKEKKITISQLAHAWVLSKGDNIIPLMGARTLSQLQDSIQCLDVHLDDDDINRIESAKKDSKILGPTMPKLIIKNGEILR